MHPHQSFRIQATKCLAFVSALVLVLISTFGTPIAKADECNHQWVLFGTHAPTCVEEGFQDFHCAICDKIKYEPLPPTGEHIWVRDKVITPPTCLREGVASSVCLICGTTGDVTLPVPPAGHDFVTTYTPQRVAKDPVRLIKYVPVAKKPFLSLFRHWDTTGNLLNIFFFPIVHSQALIS